MEERRYIVKRLNKNRPEEKSSKFPPQQKYNKLQPHVDPRFDRAFGEYSEKEFTSSFGFIKKIKKREKIKLKKQLRQEKDPEEVKKINYLLGRIKDQEREKIKRDIKQKQIDVGKQKFAEAVFSGDRPTFPTKKEQLAEDLIKNFETLNSKGKLNKFITKKHKKISKKQKKNSLDS